MLTITTQDHDSYRSLEHTITAAYADPSLRTQPAVRQAVEHTLRLIEQGRLRVLTPPGMPAWEVPGSISGNLMAWQVHAWVKQAILLAMALRTAQPFGDTWQAPGAQQRVGGGKMGYYDKFDLQEINPQSGVRRVPGSLLREGCYVAENAILMPSFVNLGAFVGEGTLIDTWATVGSCAQVGSRVHVAGGVGIGGVLEPPSARPVVIGDGAFLGSRVVVVEGVVVHEGAVLGANVCLTASTPLYDMTVPEKPTYRGQVPAYAVVAAGTRLKSFPGGEVPLQCAYIIGWRNAQTDAKVSLNDVLRESGIPV